MRIPVPSSPALALGVVCSAALGLAPAAGAATAPLKVPAPAAGQVAVAAATISGAPALKAREAGVPKGAFVTGGIVKAGGRRIALVAVARPSRSAAVRAAVSAGRAKPAGTASAAALLSADPPAALTAAVAPVCAGAAKALGHPLRRGAGAPSGAELKAFGQVLAARLCGHAIDGKGTALLGLLGLQAPKLAAKPADGVQLGPVPAPAPVAAASTTPPAPSTGGSAPPPPPPSTPACANGKDDDGDDQVDALGKGAQFFDPGCSDASDTTENSEKATPRACGLGIYTHQTRRGFGVDFDSLSFDECPKPMVKGVVDLASAITDCRDPGWEGGKGNASCDKKDGALVIAAGKGGQWLVYGSTAADLCGTKGVIVGYTADGTAWEQEMPVFDGAEACKTATPPNAAACADGLDNDGDGQVDAAGVLQAGPDPGCTSAADASEDSELPYPETGCWPIVAGDPQDPTIAYVYVTRRTALDSCPTMDAAWITFDTITVQSCLDGPYWAGAAAGTCEVDGGDAKVSGGAGDRIAVALKLSEPITCDMVFPGHIDMRAGGAVHDGVMDVAFFDAGDQLTFCR
jgi:hypothetical protein